MALFLFADGTALLSSLHVLLCEFVRGARRRACDTRCRTRCLLTSCLVFQIPDVCEGFDSEYSYLRLHLLRFSGGRRGVSERGEESVQASRSRVLANRLELARRQSK